MQSTSKILMVRPAKFGFNEQTAGNNAFQSKGDAVTAAQEAEREFDAFVNLLKENEVDLHVIQDTPQPETPDSIFPNNWFSTHEGGTLVLYPMFAPNRRLERKESVIGYIKENFGVKRVVDLSHFEGSSLFLEGTGSMVADRDNNLIYACKSVRTDERVLEEFCEETDFDYFLFGAYDSLGNPIYHTNVMMSVGSRFVVVCLDSVRDLDERENLIGLAEESDKEIIEISMEQMENFAGNMLEIKNRRGEPLLIMSQRALKSLGKEQRERLESYCKIVAPNLTVIENNGGGSARCMMAEIFI